MTLRHFFPFLLALFLVTVPAQAQPADSLILKGKRLLQRGMESGSEGPVRRGHALFERAAGSSSYTALAHYYAALADYRLANLAGENEDRAEPYLDEAVEHLKTATEADAQFAEAYALLSSVYGRKISFDPMKGMSLGPKSESAISRAKELAPENPRVVLVAAIGKYNTPGMFGGDKEAAMKGFRRAARLFEQEDVSNPLQPHWGHAEAYAWTGIAHMKADRPAQARQAFEQALAVNPNYGWVKNVLLPQLNEAQN